MPSPSKSKSARTNKTVAARSEAARQGPDLSASTVPFASLAGLDSIHHRGAVDSPDEVMRSLIQRHLVSTLARHTGSATPRDWWVATVLA